MVLTPLRPGVAQFRVPVGPPPLRRHVEQAPQRPDRIHVPGLLASRPREVEQFGVVEVMDPTIVPCEDVERGNLIALLRLAMIVRAKARILSIGDLATTARLIRSCVSAVTSSTCFRRSSSAFSSCPSPASLFHP